MPTAEEGCASFILGGFQDQNRQSNQSDMVLFHRWVHMEQEVRWEISWGFFTTGMILWLCDSMDCMEEDAHFQEV